MKTCDITRRDALGAGAILSLSGAEPQGPRRVVSLNPCLDAILVHVADRAQIAALSHYSHDLSSSSLGRLGLSFPFTYESAEEIMALRPDLVLSSTYVSAPTRGALTRLGIRTELYGLPNSVEESLAQVAQVASVVRRPLRGRALIAAIQDALVKATPPVGAPSLQALIYQTGGVATAPGTLMDDMMRRTGFTNAAARYGLKQTGTIPIERLIADPPDVLLAGQLRADAPSWADRVLSHPALRQIKSRMYRGTLPQRLTYCGGPVLIETAQALARIHRQALALRS